MGWSGAGEGRRVTKADVVPADGGRAAVIRIAVGNSAHRLTLREAQQLYAALRLAIPALVSAIGPQGTPGFVPQLPAAPTDANE